MPLSQFVVDLTTPTTATLAQFGGKAFSLKTLVAAGVPIPPSVCITTDAFSTVIRQHSTEIDRLLAECDLLSQASVLTTSDSIGLLILNCELDQRVAAELEAAYELLRAPADADISDRMLVVRSSATTEDSATESFAGQFESYLGVQTVPEMVVAVRRCWASLFGPRALVYMMEHGLDVRHAKMAVLVQRMVNADISGIAFSIDPKTGDRNTMVVNSSWGLADAIVGGHAQPDAYSVNKALRRVVSEQIATKDGGATGAADGTSVVGATAQRQKATLVGSDVEELLDLVLKIESTMGAPQDIEWVRKAGNWFVVQARPITGVARRSAEVTAWQQYVGRPLTRRFFNEWFVQPLTPLFATCQLPSLIDRANLLFRERMGMGLKPPAYDVVGGYLYTSGQLSVRRGLSGMRQFVRDSRTLATFWRDDIVPGHLARLKGLRAADIRALSDDDLLAFIVRVVDANAEYFAWNIYTGAFSMLWELTLRKAYRLAFPSDPPTRYSELLAGYENKSIEADKRLWMLGTTIRRNRALTQQFARMPAIEMLVLFNSAGLPSAVERLWRELVDEYGHRVFELDIYTPTAQEDPLSIISSLKAGLDADGPNPEDVQRRARDRREESEAGLQRSIRGRAIAPIVRTAQRFAAIRESRPFYLHMGWPILRRCVLQVGARLAGRGTLAYQNDVCFLTWEEVRSALRDAPTARDLRPAVRSRRRDWRMQMASLPPTDLEPNWLIRQLGRGDRAGTRPTEPRQVTGLAASGGQARGPARVVLGPEAFGKVRRGDVLVARYTTPAWTGLFGQIAALVTDVGGTLSHGAIIAREYGIPAVLGAKDATRQIQDGSMVEVDGDRGVVTW